MKALTMTVVAVAVAAGTYFGLKTVFPVQQEVHASQDNSDAVSRVFGGTLEETPIEAATLPEDGVVAPPPADATPEEQVAAAEAATEVAAAEAEPALEPEAVPEPEAAPEPEVAVEPNPTPAPAAAPAPSAPAPVAATKPAKQPAKPAASPSTKRQNPAPTWWGTSVAGRLNLVYAGSAAYKRAIVLMFDGDLKDATAVNRSVKVVDASGKPVAARWELNSNNPRMAVLPLEAAGIYRVTVGAGLVDARGRTLGATQQGPVQIP